jgi:hypothetical protein
VAIARAGMTRCWCRTPGWREAAGDLGGGTQPGHGALVAALYRQASCALSERKAVVISGLPERKRRPRPLHRQASTRPVSDHEHRPDPCRDGLARIRWRSRPRPVRLPSRTDETAPAAPDLDIKTGHLASGKVGIREERRSLCVSCEATLWLPAFLPKVSS